MIEKSQLVPLEAVWGTMKDLVKKSHPEIGGGMGSLRESEKDIPKIMLARNERWMRPQTPVTATSDLLNGMATELVTKIEALFQTKFVEMPHMHVVVKDDFLPILNESEQNTSKQLGYGFHHFESPPGMYMNQVDGTIVVPENFLARVPRGVYRGAAHTDFEVEEYSWERPFLEEVLYEELVHVMFRQVRGEWKQGFIDCMKAVPDSASSITAVNEAVALRVKALRVLDDRDQWGMFVAAEVLAALQAPASQIAYRGVEGLAPVKTIRQIAMVDRISTQGGAVNLDFDSAHPNHDAKLWKYNEVL